MDFENNAVSKKTAAIIGIFIVLLIIVLIIYLINRGGNTTPVPSPLSPTPARISMQPTEPTTIQPTVNYETPFPQVSVPLTGTPEDLMKNQIESDKKWGEAYTQVHEEYPWIDQFPVTSEYFFLYFQTGSNTFIGKIYDKSQEETLKQTMLNILKDKNIDMNKYTVEWTYAE